MPGGYPIAFDICNAQNAGASTSTSIGTAVTASGSTNTKGSWVQLVASLANDCCWITIDLLFDGSPFGASPTPEAVDIGIGAGGSEVVLIADLMVNPGYTLIGVARYSFPIHIPAGTRVSARSQCPVASGVVNVSINTFDGGFSQQEGYSGVDSIGFNSGTTLGTVVTPSATANTLGSYAQLTASTSKDYVGIFAYPDDQKVGSAVKALVDIAIGGAGSEIVIIPQNQVSLGTSTGNYCGALPWRPISIPAGTRIAARAQAAAASTPAIGLTLYGVF